MNRNNLDFERNYEWERANWHKLPPDDDDNRRGFDSEDDDRQDDDKGE